MRHFKIPLIATAITLVVMTVVGLILISQAKGMNNERAQMLGQGMAFATLVLIFPFWIYGASQMGKERREALLKPKAKLQKKSRRSNDGEV